MVVTYLEKTREKLQEKRIHINSLLIVANSQFRENVEFIKLLEENNDPNFEAFTPRQVNGFNKRKIDELAETQKELTARIEQLTEELKQIDSSISEVAEVIKVAKEEKRLLSDLNK